MSDELRFSVPATSAHLGPGFGVLAVALDLLAHVVVRTESEGGHRIERHGTAEARALDPRHDAVLRGLAAATQQLDLKLPQHLTIRYDTNVPYGAGFGTQTAEYAAGVGVAARFAKKPPVPDELLQLAISLGADPAHAAAALHGGLTAACQVHGPHSTTSEPRYQLQPHPIHADWRVVLVCPELRLATADSRRVLPPTLPHGVTPRTAGRILGLLRALATADETDLHAWLVDEVHVPFRRRLIPGLDTCLAAGRDAGAAGVTISGHGPALVALTTDGDRCEAIANAMVDAFAGAGQQATTRTVGTCAVGAVPPTIETADAGA